MDPQTRAGEQEKETPGSNVKTELQSKQRLESLTQTFYKATNQ